MIKDNVDITKKIYYKYAIDVVEGRRVANELVTLACKRFLNDLQRPDLLFDSSLTTEVARFFYSLRHFEAPFTGKPFILTPPQSFIIANIFSMLKQNSLGEWVRKYKFVDVLVSRKFGKSSLMAGLALYELVKGTIGGECVFCATTRDQAKEALKYATSYAESIDPKHKFLKVTRDGIRFEKRKSVIKIVSSEAGHLDGGNTSLGLHDESAAHANSNLYDVIQSSQVARREPLMICISTPQPNKENFYFKKLQVDEQILRGVTEGESTFAYICGLDEGDDWEDETVWEKVQPHLGETVLIDVMREQKQIAKNEPERTSNILCKTFCIWADNTVDVFIESSYVQKRMTTSDNKPYNLDLENFRDWICYWGVDLSSTDDLSSISLLFYDPEHNKYYVKNWCFLPDESLKKSPNKEFYKLMVKQGHLILIPNSNVIDYDWILNKMWEIIDHYDLNIVGCAYDPYSSTALVTSATEIGIPMYKFSQGFGNFSGPTKELKRLILKGDIIFDCNPLLLWMFNNITIKSDHNGNIKVSKINHSSSKKVDGIISTIEALGLCMSMNGITPEIINVEA